jgi:hypothetical protein
MNVVEDMSPFNEEGLFFTGHHWSQASQGDQMPIGYIKQIDPMPILVSARLILSPDSLSSGPLAHDLN